MPAVRRRHPELQSSTVSKRLANALSRLFIFPAEEKTMADKKKTKAKSGVKKKTLKGATKVGNAKLMTVL